MRAPFPMPFLLPLALLVTVLTGCAGGPPEEGDVAPPPSPTPEATETAPPPAQPASFRFVAPTSCDAILSADRLERFQGDGLDLLGGPGGRYGTDYFAEPTPEEQVGGITCVWGDESQPATTITVSVAPLSAAVRATVVEDLIAQGLNETQVGNAIGFGEVGDEVSAPCVLNVLRTDSWISVIEALGGEQRFLDATEIAEEVASLVYVARD